MVFDFFKNKKEKLQKEEFRIEDLVLSKLKVGFLVDYDLKTIEFLHAINISGMKVESPTNGN